MKKNNKILLLALIVLLVLSIIVLFTKYDIKREVVDGKKKIRIEQKSGSLKVLRDFAVPDTAAVNKIFLADKSNNTILLERSGKQWKVNDTYTAREDFIQVLLETIARVEVYSPVPVSNRDYVLRNMAANGIKCEIYQNNKRVKTYYVGGVTQNNQGTYMLLENSSEPFVVSIPGFTGYLTVRYSTAIEEWRSRRVFSYDFNEIASVDVKFPDQPKESYRMENKGNNQFDLIALDGNKSMENFDTILVKQQIGRFKKVGFEFFVDDETKQYKIDSLTQLTPMWSFVVTDINGNERLLNCYERKNADKLKDDEGVPYAEDIERLYGVFDNELIVLQYYTMDALSLKLSDIYRK
ncbi:MAG: hypothetical protein CSA94_01565 [Bacteroidetes bacterium]|nr:MAG: hypothetical protein CSA94_01565 [Bacteroidota bacterium]